MINYFDLCPALNKTLNIVFYLLIYRNNNNLILYYTTKTRNYSRQSVHG